MHKNKSSLAKCAQKKKNEAALARSPEKAGLFLLILDLHICGSAHYLEGDSLFPPLFSGY